MLSVRWLVACVIGGMVGAGAASPATAQFDGLKDKLKKKTDDAVKEAERELDKALKGEKDEAAKKDEGGKPADAAGGAGAPQPTPGAAAPAGAWGAGALDVPPSRVVELGMLKEDVQIDSIVFAPGLDRAAWVGRKGSRQAVYVNGEPGPVGDEVVGRPMFSRDGARVAYVIRKGDQKHLVVDGRESAGFMHIDPETIRFSADGTHYAAIGARENAEGNNESYLIMDGIESGPRRGMDHLRFVGGQAVYTYWRPEENGYSTPMLMYGGGEIELRKGGQYSWQDDEFAGEAAIGSPIAIVAVNETDEQLWIGRPVGQVLRGIREVEVSPDGSAWSCIAALPEEPGPDGTPTHVVVVNGEVVLRIKGRRSDDVHSGLRVLFAETGSDFAILENVNYSGVRVHHRGVTHPEYEHIDFVRLTGGGELSYWAVMDGYLYRVVNGEESDGIAGSIEKLPASLDAMTIVRGVDAPLMFNEDIKARDPRGRDYTERVLRVALGSWLSPRAKRIDSYGVSGDGSMLAMIAAEPEGKGDGCWAMCGAVETMLSASGMNGVKGEWRLDETGANCVLVVEARGRHEFPPDAAGNTPIRRMAKGDNTNSLHLLRNGRWEGDLYGGREISWRTRVRGVTFTPDLRHTLHWLGVSDADPSAFNVEPTWTLHFDGRPLNGPAPMYTMGPEVAPAARPGYPYQPFEAQELACGSVSEDGRVFRYIAREGEAIRLVEYDIAALEAAAAN